MPDVPSMREAGLSDVTIYNWIGLAGPARMPKELVNRLHAEVAKAIAVPSVKAHRTGRGTGRKQSGRIFQADTR
jgi:tripartite-type tricarboxylate transporter receptor subunit TctC